MADYMSAREAWEIVLEGNPAHEVDAEWEYVGPGNHAENYALALATYARACAIVGAAIHAHEGLDELSDYDVPIRTVKVRALERGDEIPKVNVRALERGEGESK